MTKPPVTAREEFELNFDEPLSFELPALVVSALARPGVSDVAARQDLYEVLCAWFVFARAVGDPEWARSPIKIQPAFITISDAMMKGALRTVERRLRDRLAAGRIAIAFLKEAESGAIPDLPDGVARLSINELAKWVAASLGIESPENVESRIWRPSTPVIHVVAAWEAIMREGRLSSGAPNLVELYARPGLLRLIIERAQLYEPLLAKSRLRIPPERLIRFRIAGVKNSATS